MKIKNNGPKIINIGSTVLLPGEEAVFPDKYVDTPAINTLERFGFITKMKESPEEAVKEVDAPAPLPAEDPEDEDDDDFIPGSEVKPEVVKADEPAKAETKPAGRGRKASR